MSKRRRPEEQIELPFVDLPLHSPPSREEAVEPATTHVLRPGEDQPKPPPDDVGELTLFSQEEGKEGEEAYETPDQPLEASSEASPRDLVLAGLADLSAIVVVLGGVALGVKLMGVPLLPADVGPFGVLGLIFSFLYWVIPLAFWGQTPGMAWLGLMCHSIDQEPLTFGQAVWRWLGALLTLATAGLPLMLALAGRSLSDRLSGSKTVAL